MEEQCWLFVHCNASSLEFLTGQLFQLCWKVEQVLGYTLGSYIPMSEVHCGVLRLQMVSHLLLASVINK